jgi:hypothetical protein
MKAKGNSQIADGDITKAITEIVVGPGFTEVPSYVDDWRQYKFFKYNFHVSYFTHYVLCMCNLNKFTIPRVDSL